MKKILIPQYEIAASFMNERCRVCGSNSERPEQHRFRRNVFPYYTIYPEHPTAVDEVLAPWNGGFKALSEVEKNTIVKALLSVLWDINITGEDDFDLDIMNSFWSPFKQALQKLSFETSDPTFNYKIIDGEQNQAYSKTTKHSLDELLSSFDSESVNYPSERIYPIAGVLRQFEKFASLESTLGNITVAPKDFNMTGHSDWNRTFPEALKVLVKKENVDYSPLNVHDSTEYKQTYLLTEEFCSFVDYENINEYLSKTVSSITKRNTEMFKRIEEKLNKAYYGCGHTNY